MGRQIKIPGDRTYEDWNVNVMLDSTVQIRHDFFDWHEEINATKANVGPGNVSSIKVDAFVTAFKYDGSLGIRYKFVGLWPSTVGTVELSKDSQDSVAEISCTFSYDYFERA